MKVKVSVTGTLELDGKDVKALRGASVEEAAMTLVAQSEDVHVTIRKPKEGMAIRKPKKAVTIKEPEKEVAIKEPEKEVVIKEPEVA